MPIQGKNSEIVHNGERYHVQTESWEPREKILVSQVFRSGKVVFKKKHNVISLLDFSEEDVLKAHNEVMKSVQGLLI